jgi:hypothetical protein
MGLIIACAWGVICGFMAGKWHARIKWNELITAGVLPKPKRGKKP